MCYSIEVVDGLLASAAGKAAMTKVLVNNKSEGWVVDKGVLLKTLDRLGWTETTIEGKDARIEPDDFDGSKPPYARLCEALPRFTKDFSKADLEFVWHPEHDAWVWEVIVPAIWPEEK